MLGYVGRVANANYVNIAVGMAVGKRRSSRCACAGCVAVGTGDFMSINGGVAAGVWAVCIDRNGMAGSTACTGSPDCGCYKAYAVRISMAGGVVTCAGVSPCSMLYNVSGVADTNYINITVCMTVNK
jgi:hypothetical protein